MKITIETDLVKFDLIIDITHIEPFEPVKLYGHPDTWQDSSGGDIDYDIVSAIPYGYETMQISLNEWAKLNDEEKKNRSDLTMKCLSLQNGHVSKSENKQILEGVTKS